MSFPTRNNNILDLCFTTDPDLVQSCHSFPGVSDHDTVLLKFKLQITHPKQPRRKIYLYSKANWDAIREKLVTLSDQYFLLNQNTQRTVEDNWNFFHSHILKLIEEDVPSKYASNKTNRPWMSASLKRLIRKKQRLYNCAKRFNNHTKWREYKETRQKVHTLMRQQHTNYLSSALFSDNSNGKKLFWRYIKDQKKDNVTINSLKSQTGSLVFDSQQKSEILNHQFQTVFTIEDFTNFPQKGPSHYPHIDDIEITNSGVCKLLSDCNPHKSAGPDSIHSCFLKNAANEIAPMLTHLFQSSLITGTIPSIWKQAYVTPIYKTGSRSDAKNYRPISLTSIICKTLEHIICRHIMNHLDANDILFKHQYGFRSKHSCETQLLTAIDDFAKAVNNKKQTDACMLDFSKAFDKVPHQRLLHKLEFYGITGDTLAWLKAFLSNRSQQVALNGVLSSPCKVNSGVPQGSVLGPILFLMYINDIADGVQSQLRLFADDCIIYRTINSPEDHKILQQDLNQLSMWAKTWQMEFNVSKCNILRVSHLHTTSNFAYTLYDTKLKSVKEHKYLGIWINEKLSWRTHILYTCNKANRTLGFLQRNLRGCPTYLKEQAYKQLVLPLLEYCAPVWDPHHQTDILKLESVQRRAARFVLNKPWLNNTNNDSVTEMLIDLKWPTLQSHRKHLRLILFFKVINKLQLIPENYLPTPARLTSTRSNHPCKFSQIQPSCDTYKFSFFPRTIPEWNNLHINNINNLTLEDFKCILCNLN